MSLSPLFMAKLWIEQMGLRKCKLASDTPLRSHTASVSEFVSVGSQSDYSDQSDFPVKPRFRIGPDVRLSTYFQVLHNILMEKSNVPYVKT